MFSNSRRLLALLLFAVDAHSRHATRVPVNGMLPMPRALTVPEICPPAIIPLTSNVNGIGLVMAALKLTLSPLAVAFEYIRRYYRHLPLPCRSAHCPGISVPLSACARRSEFAWIPSRWRLRTTVAPVICNQPSEAYVARFCWSVAN